MDKEINVILQDIEKALDYSLPDKADARWISSSFGKGSFSEDNFITLIEPNKNLIKLGGKRWRPLLMILYYLNEKNEGKLSYETACALTPLVEFVHAASLIHDDIEDGADLRRGKPAAHITYGIDTAINSASWLYFEASACIENQNISDKTKLLLYRLYTNELRKLHLGQALDIKWHRDSSYYPTEEEYYTMVKCKTGTLASLAASLGSVCAGNDPEKTENAGQSINLLIDKGFEKYIYYGRILTSKDHYYLELVHENEDRISIILHRPNTRKPEYIGGIGTVNSVSRGRQHMPTVQFIGLSRKALNLSEEDIHKAMLLSYPNYHAGQESEELIKTFKNLYMNNENTGFTFNDTQRELLVQSNLERIIKESLTRNLLRYAKVSEIDDDEWYHTIKYFGIKEEN